MSLELKINPNQVVETARQELLDWWEEEGNVLGKGDDYKAVAIKVQEAAKDLQRVDMAIYYHWFRFGFDFYYGKKPNDSELVPLSFWDGRVISIQFESDPESACWPIKDPKTDTYYVPHITNKEKVPPPSGSTPTDQYLAATIRRANMGSQQDRRILKALYPYAESIKACDECVYNDIQEFFPAEFQSERVSFKDLDDCRTQ